MANLVTILEIDFEYDADMENVDNFLSYNFNCCLYQKGSYI